MPGLERSTKSIPLVRKTAGVSPYEAWRQKIIKNPNPVFYCPECGRRLWHDLNIIQRHFMFEHIKDNKVKAGLGWKFKPTTI